MIMHVYIYIYIYICTYIHMILHVCIYIYICSGDHSDVPAECAFWSLELNIGSPFGTNQD